jgi:hypothetical protein
MNRKKTSYQEDSSSHDPAYREIFKHGEKVDGKLPRIDEVLVNGWSAVR